MLRGQAITLHIHSDTSTIDVINVFYVFIQVTFLCFLTLFIFSMFFFIFKKRWQINAKYKYVKIQLEIFLEDDLAMIFIDFGLLRSVTYTAKYLTCLLKSIEVIKIWEFDNLHMTQCAKIIVGFMANVGNVFYPTSTNVFFIFHTFFTFLNVFYLHLNVYYIYDISWFP